MNKTYNEVLRGQVIALSVSDTWEDAVSEWGIIGCEEDLTASSQCVCGKENIRYQYTISNSCNGEILFPIGSSCIQKFGREDLNQQIILQEGMFRLYHAISAGEFITLTSAELLHIEHVQFCL